MKLVYNYFANTAYRIYRLLCRVVGVGVTDSANIAVPALLDIPVAAGDGLSPTMFIRRTLPAGAGAALVPVFASAPFGFRVLDVIFRCTGTAGGGGETVAVTNTTQGVDVTDAIPNAGATGIFRSNWAAGAVPAAVVAGDQIDITRSAIDAGGDVIIFLERMS